MDFKEQEFHKDSIGNAQELVVEYEARKARIRAGRGAKKGRKDGRT
jgi:hypothetical protein